jgi:hypothetical protein
MFVKELPKVTLQDLLDEAVPPTRTFTVPAAAIAVHTNHDDSPDNIRIGDGEYPFTEGGLLALGQHLRIPSTFLAERLPPNLVEPVVNTMLTRAGGDVEVAVSESAGLMDVFAPNGRRLDPRQVLEVAARVMSPTDQVVGWRRDNQGYGFEVVKPVDYEVDAVRDISRGGLRFGQETKTNSVPWVQPYIYRLACTNGMEIPDETVKITSQGRTLEAVIEELEAAAEIAFARVEADIAAFYAMKSVRVEDPEKVMTRYAREQGFNDRRTRMILETLPEYEDEDGSASQFALVNAITNQANDPSLAWAAARSLQRAGGHLAFAHSYRCPKCSSKLS